MSGLAYERRHSSFKGVASHALLHVESHVFATLLNRACHGIVDVPDTLRANSLSEPTACLTLFACATMYWFDAAPCLVSSTAHTKSGYISSGDLIRACVCVGEAMFCVRSSCAYRRMRTLSPSTVPTPILPQPPNPSTMLIEGMCVSAGSAPVLLCTYANAMGGLVYWL